MKKLFLSFTVLAAMAFTFTGCEDVPQPYATPTEDNSKGDDIVSQGTGTQSDPFNVTAALEFIENGLDLNKTVYVTGTVVSIESIDTSYGNATYKISDVKNSTTNALTVYRGLSLGNKKFTSEDELKVGDVVTVWGTLVNYNGTKEFTTGNYIYSLNGKTSGGDTGGDVTPTGDGTQSNPYNVAAAYELVSNLGVDETTDEAIYVKGKISSISQVETENYGNANYYITDDGNNSIYIFQSYYLGNVKFTSSDQIKVGDEVVIYGKFVNYKGNTPETVGKGSSYIYSLNGKTADGSQTTTGLYESFDESQGNFTIDNISLGDGLSYVWAWNSSKYMKASAYANKTYIPAQSRLVSPAFSLKGLTSATLTFDHASKYFADAATELKVQASTDGKTWTDLKVSAYPDGSSWDFVTATCDLSAYAGKDVVYIGFLYTSTDAAAATWEVKNVEVK